MSGPEKPRVEVVEERLEQAILLLSWVDCPPRPYGWQCNDYDGDCSRCWLEYLKGEYPHE